MMLALPFVEETQRNGKLVFWVDHKEAGGKRCAVLDLELRSRKDGSLAPPVSFSAGAEQYYELLEREGFVPAPYLARAYWVGLEKPDTLPFKELEALAKRAHALTHEKLPQRTKAALGALAPS